jgi:uncharacterized protein
MRRMKHIFRCAGLIALVSVLATAWQPLVSTQPARKKLLFLTHAGLYKHSSLGPAEKAVSELGKAGGYDVTTVEGYKQDADKIDLSFLTPAYLNSFDGLMLMTNGNLPFTEVQKRAIMDFVRNGKGLAGAHCATLTLYNTPEFGEMLGGYYLRSIVPMNLISAGKVGLLKVEDTTHPATKMLGTTWPIDEEFYQFGGKWDASRPEENLSQVGKFQIPIAFTRDRIHVLLSLDTERMDISDIPQIKKGGDYPQAWSRTYGSGRVFYTSLGHRDESWSDPVFRAHINGGVRYALGIEK